MTTTQEQMHYATGAWSNTEEATQSIQTVLAERMRDLNEAIGTAYCTLEKMECRRLMARISEVVVIGRHLGLTVEHPENYGKALNYVNAGVR